MGAMESASRPTAVWAWRILLSQYMVTTWPRLIHALQCRLEHSSGDGLRSETLGRRSNGEPRPWSGMGSKKTRHQAIQDDVPEAAAREHGVSQSPVPSPPVPKREADSVEGRPRGSRGSRG